MIRSLESGIPAGVFRNVGDGIKPPPLIEKKEARCTLLVRFYSRKEFLSSIIVPFWAETSRNVYDMGDPGNISG